MIKNAVIHINNEQPLIADLFEMPSPSDVTIRCTNLRQLNGKRPVFADDLNSVFVFAWINIRFVEILPSSSTQAGDRPMVVSGARQGAGSTGAGPDVEADLEIDEDFLRRIREV